MNKRNKIILLILAGLFLIPLFLNFSSGIGNAPGVLLQKLLILPAVLIGISFHEAAHGYVSHWLGDPTPKMQGRLTLNPIAHMDMLGFFALLLVGFGWGKPVMIDPRYYKKPRRDELLVSLAGVTANLIIAIVFAILQVILINNGYTGFSGGFASILNSVITYIVIINLVLMVFNLLPIPPLDGFSIVTQLFNLRKYSWYYPLYQRGFLILMVLVFIGFLDGFLGHSVDTVYYWIMSFALRVF